MSNYISNDNNKIISSINKLLYFYKKYLYKKKQKYFFDFCAKIYSSSNYHYKSKNNIHNRLYNCSFNKQKIIRDLEQKISQNEEKECTFSPKTNNGKIKCKFSPKDKKELFEIKINNPRYSYSFKSSNINNNKILNNDDINNNNRIIEYNNLFSITNPLFYHNNKTINANEINSYNIKKKYNIINYDNNDLLYNNNYNNKLDNNIKKMINNKKNKNNFFNNKSFLEEKFFNKTSRNSNYIKKSKTNNPIYCLNNDKNNSNSPKNYFRSSKYILIGNSNKNLIKNRIDGNYSRETLNPQNNLIFNLFKKMQSVNKKENGVQFKVNKSFNDLKDIGERINNLEQNKRKNSQQKNNPNSFNGIMTPFSILTDKKHNHYEKMSYESFNYKSKNNNEDNSKFSHKKSKSLNHNKKLKHISSPILNNCINAINFDYEDNNNINDKIILSKKIFDLKENGINYYDKIKNNQTLDKKENQHTFRKGKIPFNYFNYLSTKRISHNQIKNKSNNPISLIDIQNKENYYSAKYNPNINRTNSIYLNNYNRKICRIKKDKCINNNSFNKNNKIKRSCYDLTCRKDSSTKQISYLSNTNFNTNNETKGCSISSFSLYPTKSPKENQSIKNSSRSRQENNNSIVICKNQENNSNQKFLNNKKQKKKSKQSIKKYINSFNDNESIIQNKNNALDYYCLYYNEKHNQSKSNNLEIDSNVVNECYINNNDAKNKIKNILNSGKNEKSMTLQSLSDSKILELADHYINNGEDSLDQMDFKLMELRKNFKKEKNCRDITFG